ncbi:MAG TPA: hypothetical protein VGE74_30145 [Gemmata sp.]
MSRTALLVAAVAFGVVVGYVIRPLVGSPGSSAVRGTEIFVNRPDPTNPLARTSHTLRVYRKHGDPIQPREGGDNLWLVSVRTSRGEETYFAEPAESAP